MAVNWKEIDRIAQAHQSIDPTASEEDLFRQLKIWWCIKYTRPFKDPLIESYNLDELVYEYLMWFYMNPENDPAAKKEKERREKEDQEWALAQIKSHQSIPKPSKPSSPTRPTKKRQKKQKPTNPPSIPDLPEISTKFEE
jgi:hypothetical protein